MNVRIGILDTGIAADDVVARRTFMPDHDSDVEWPPAQAGEHGSRLASIVRCRCPAAILFDARAFRHGAPASARQVATAIDWLVELRVDVINMSFGLRENRLILAQAVLKAQRSGILCVAASPAAGAVVFPAAYPGVVRVSGDARCSAGQFSLLQPAPHLRIGAAAGGPHHQAHQRGGGASFACAHVSAELGLLKGRGLDAQQAVQKLVQACDWQGRECRI